MRQLAPLGPVYQAGTLSGNPVATACGLATLRLISQPGFFETLAARTRALADGLQGVARDIGVPLLADSEGGMFGFFFTRSPDDALPQHYGAVMATDAERFNRFFHAMLERGVYLAPAPTSPPRWPRRAKRCAADTAAAPAADEARRDRPRRPTAPTGGAVGRATHPA